LGGNGFDEARYIAVDPFGDVVLVGETKSSNFPATQGAYDETFNGSSDIFVAKFDISYVASPGTLQFGSATFNGGESSGNATITVNRTGGSLGTVKVDYATSEGSATAGLDYTNTSGTLTFDDGVGSQTFDVPILGDDLVEGDETVNLTLSNATGGSTLGSRKTAVLNIIDDDFSSHGALKFDSTTFSSGEASGNATITVIRIGGSDGKVEVDYTTNNGSATAGLDYADTSGTLTFDDGVILQTFDIPIFDDPDLEGSETVNLTLSNATAGAILTSPSTATLMIIDDDASTFNYIPALFFSS
jgi:hypothetical protein